MNRFVQKTASFLMSIFAMVWFRLRVVGLDKIPPDGGCIVIANHTSHADPPILGAIIKRDKWFLARQSLGKFRLGHFLLEKLGVIFVDRDAPSRTSMQSAIDCVANGGLLIMFPEGTRSRDGKVGSFQRGVELILRRAKDAKVVPVGLRGVGAAFPRGAILPRPRRCEAHFGEPIAVADLKSLGGIDVLRHKVAELAEVSLAETETETNSPDSGASSAASSGSSFRGPDGPAAAEGVRRTS